MTLAARERVRHSKKSQPRCRRLQPMLRRSTTVCAKAIIESIEGRSRTPYDQGQGPVRFTTQIGLHLRRWMRSCGIVLSSLNINRSTAVTLATITEAPSTLISDEFEYKYSEWESYVKFTLHSLVTLEHSSSSSLEMARVGLQQTLPREKPDDQHTPSTGDTSGRDAAN